MSLADLNSWTSGDAKTVAQLAYSGLAPKDFYTQFLSCLPRSASLMGSVAWTCQADSFSKLAAHGGGTIDPGITATEHATQLHKARSKAEPEIVRASGVDDGLTIAIFPIVVDEQVPVLIESYLRADLSEEAVDAFSREMLQLCQLASLAHDERPPAADSMGLTPHIHQSLVVRDTAYSVANEGRRALDCDRVTVLRNLSGKYRVESVSGQESFQRRANAIRQLETLTTKVLKTGQSFWYPDEASQLPPQIESELEQYLEISLARRLGIVPLAVADLAKRAGSDVDNAPEKIVGALVIEEFTESAGGHGKLLPGTNILATEAAVALQNAIAHEDIFLLPVWRKLGSMRSLFRGKTRWKTCAALASVMLLLLLLRFVPAELKVAAEGSLMPSDRQVVFAQHEGTVIELAAAHGERVATGQSLARLRNHDVELAIQRARGEIRKTQSQVDAIRAQRFTNATPTARSSDSRVSNEAAAEEENLKVLLASLEQQLAILEARQARLNVHSPIDGQVMTWNLEQQLLDRPVNRGQQLMEVADFDGEWRLELNLPDKRIADLLKAQEEGEPLEVEYLLASDSKQKLRGIVQQIARTTRVDSENGQHVMVHVQIAKEDVPLLQPGTGIQAKIHCGRRSLGYVWLRDLWHFVRAKVLFRIT